MTVPRTKSEWQEHFDAEYPDGACVAFLDPEVDEDTPSWESPAGIVPRVMVLEVREDRPIVGLLAPEFPHATIAWWRTETERSDGLGTLYDTSDGRRFLVNGLVTGRAAERTAELRENGWQWDDYEPDETEDWSWVG